MVTSSRVSLNKRSDDEYSYETFVVIDISDGFDLIFGSS
ncbi:hypothetical protein W04_0349 [Pseudoalteromonas sp. SW0106-04]|nr:hypothetical protein W04_0349 [Pseudoalteromonas sp. SW0106-04]